MSELFIGWTTCDNSDVAERLAYEIVERDLAACVQIDDGVRSIFKWKGQIQNDLECRLWIKFSEDKLDAINNFIKANHPYENPEWVVVHPDIVMEKYLKWATGE
jgi:periplasmic divalent cation tolerance protein